MLKSDCTHTAGGSRRLTDDLRIRNLLDDPALRDVLGIAGGSDAIAERRPLNIRRLLEDAAA